MEDSFCSVPWRQLSTKPNGNIRICCLMSNSSDPDKGVLRRSDNSIYNARDPDFITALDNPKIKKLRLDMLQGKKNSLCETCWKKESIGLKSKRQVTNKMLRSDINLALAKEQTDSTGSLAKVKINYLDLRLGNECNLKCIMCHPASSSKWYGDYSKLYDTNIFRDTKDKVEIIFDEKLWKLKNSSYYEWYKNETFWDSLNQHLPNIRQIYLVGGEPLLIKEQTNFLVRLVDSGYAKNIVLEYDTNLTLLPDNIIKIWQSFKKIKMRVSVESTGLQNNYIRFPSKWSKIISNISALENSTANIEINFSITWQIYNLFAVSQLWEEYPALGNVRILSSPKHLDIKILPKNIKLEAIKHLRSLKINSPKISEQVTSMVKYLNEHLEFYDEPLMKRFLEFTKKSDSIRNTNFSEVFPKLSSLLLDNSN